MKASPACLTLIRASEGLRLTPYLDLAGYWTVGYGRRLRPGHKLRVLTEAEAETMLEADVGAAEIAVLRLTPTLALTQGQFDALVDFTFQMGPAKLFGSTLLAKLKAGDLVGAADEFLNWDKAHVGGGLKVEVPGLRTRREADRAMFLGAGPG